VENSVDSGENVEIVEKIYLSDFYLL
jgi:hypothetical protein